jgi:uncharacterized protein
LQSRQRSGCPAQRKPGRPLLFRRRCLLPGRTALAAARDETMVSLPLCSEPVRPIVPFHTYIWKIASRCNLNCSYCFIYNMADQRWQRQPAFMSEGVARQAAARLREHCWQHNQHEVHVILHGGEPLLAGVERIRRFMTILKDELTGSGINCRVGCQSNGLLFNEEIGDLFVEFDATIGISLDGPPEVNDRFRLDHAGQPVSAQLEKRLELLCSPRYRRLFHGLLCVMDPQTDPIRVTDYLLSFEPPGFDYLLPHHNWVDPPPGKRHDRQAAPYGDWLIRAFDHWFAAKTSSRIRFFDAIMRRLCGAPSGLESLGTSAVDLIVVETNGELEAVDSLKSTFNGATHLGYNVFDHDFDTVAADHRVQARQLHFQGLCRQCQECSLAEVCGGGYIPHRYAGGTNFANPSVYCADLMKLIRHIRQRLGAELAKAKLLPAATG